MGRNYGSSKFYPMAERIKIQIENKAAGSWRPSIPACPFQRFDHMWQPPQVPPWLGGCQLGFCAALDADNEKLQTSLHLITGRVCWDCSASPLQDVMIGQSAHSQLDTGRRLTDLRLWSQKATLFYYFPILG